MFLVLLLFLFHSQATFSRATIIIGDEQQISDDVARMALAELLSQGDDTANLAEAEVLVRQVLVGKPDNHEAQALQATLMLKLGRLPEALKLAERLHTSFPDSQPWLLLLADVHVAAGHYAICRDLYRQALLRAPENSDLALQFLDLSNLWGDFDMVEKHLRALLEKLPNDQTLRLRLGRVLFSQQRYEEAAVILRAVQVGTVADSEIWREATLTLVDVHRMEKDFASALATCRSAIQQEPRFLNAVLIEGELLLLTGLYSEAEIAFRKAHALSKDDNLRHQALVGLGRSLLQQGVPQKAVTPLLEAVRMAPHAIKPQFYLRLAQGISPENMPLPEQSTAPILYAWAETLASEGANLAAIKYYRQALKVDPQHFQSRMGLARTLATVNRYTEALSMLENLNIEFPESATVQLTLARVLAWDRQYMASLQHYEMMIQRNPGAYPLRTEMARTAYWGKMSDLGDRSYKAIYAMSVDQQLSRLNLQLSEQGKESPVAITEFTKKNDGVLNRWTNPPPYLLYEYLQQQLPSIQSELRGQIEKALIELEPEYRLQKAAYLEQQAKVLTHNRRPIRAHRILIQLLEIRPGNEEALFDLAQNQCELGLFGCERDTWKRLAQLDPAHNLANYALLRSSRRSSRPNLSVGYSVLDELGHGDLSRMTHEHAQTQIEIPFQDQYKFTVASHQFRELPGEYGPTREAYGQSLGLDGVFNEYFASSAEVLAKWYDGGPEETLIGQINILLNLDDYLKVGLGYRRSEEYANTFAMEDDVQADRLRASLTVSPHRQLEMGLGYEQIYYTDSNDQQMADGRIKLFLNDHPHTLSIEANVEYRHTNEVDRYIYQGDTLLDIVHPYWTPQHYYTAGATLEWRHDISKFYFCGSPLHYYDLKLTGGSDSDGNPFFRGSAEWHWEFREGWTWDIAGISHYSEQWRSQSLVTGLSYQF